MTTSTKAPKAPKIFTVVTRRYRRVGADSITEYTDTLENLIQTFKYSLETGESYQHEKGNKKINTNPKSIKSLITNLNNAIDNAAMNGCGNTSYSLKEQPSPVTNGNV